MLYAGAGDTVVNAPDGVALGGYWNREQGCTGAVFTCIKLDYPRLHCSYRTYSIRELFA